MDSRVDAYVAGAEQWQEELEQLRAILLDCPLTEEVKWGKPCYTFEGSNVVILQSFKKYCALLFFKGVLMSDPEGILVKTGENTRVGRQIRFTSVRDVVELKPAVEAYVAAAIELERSGQKVAPAEKPEPVLPSELESAFEGDGAFRDAFRALTPGRQREYAFYFSAPKQARTRDSRIEKCIPQILDGQGLRDGYTSARP
jgi:uncharacterized protein YdeI (YjbR/CyaY-like superfamily)